MAISGTNGSEGIAVNFNYAYGGPGLASLTIDSGNLLSVATALPWTFMWRHLVRHPELLEPPLDASYARAELRRGSIGPVVYLFAIPIALIARRTYSLLVTPSALAIFSRSRRNRFGKLIVSVSLM